MNIQYDTSTYRLHDCTPNASQRRLLTAVLDNDEAALEAWRDWCSDNDIEDIESASFRLLPFIYLRLKVLAPEDPLLPRLKVVYRHSWFKNQVLSNQARQAAETLALAGIDTMLLKGGAMGLGYYPDAGARFMHDVDLMVRPVDFNRAMALLDKSGWQIQETSLRNMRIARYFGFVHGCSFKRGEGELDLHAQLSRFVWQNDDIIWGTANQVAWGKSDIQLPSATVALYHSCVHGVRWSYATLTWIPDAMTILGHDAAAIDWDSLLELAVQSRSVCQLHHALTYLAIEWQAPIPGRVLKTLAISPTSWVEQREYASLAIKPQRRLVQLAKRLWFRSCRFRQGGREARRPIRVSVFAWLAYLALYKLAPRG